MHKFLPLAFLAFILSCTIDPYDAGDGKYSYYTAEMASFIPDNDTLIYTGQLDDNRKIQLSQKIRLTGAQPDSLCRMMLYFNKLSESAAEITAQPIGAKQCYLPNIQLADTLKKMPKTDPLTLISTWRSNNGEFYNIHFAIKTGETNTQTPQYIGLVCDSITNDSIVHIHVIHDQNGAPEFYSVEGFMSISKQKLQTLAGVNNPKLKLHVNTYDGERTF